MTSHPRAKAKAEDPHVTASVLDVHAENLQIADSMDRVVDLIRLGVGTLAGVGTGAIFLVDERNQPSRVATIRGPQAADLAAPAIELTGMARRAIREGETVRQTGVSAGLLWAVPMKSPRGIEGVVAAVGELGDLPRFLAHAGLALARERSRDEEDDLRLKAEERAANLERAVEILDRIAREGGTDNVLRSIAGATASVTGIGRTSLWTLRADDGLYVEIARAENGGPQSERPPELGPPASARRADALGTWLSRLPRWSGCAWVPVGTIERPQPGVGDTLVLTFEGLEGPHPHGFLLVEISGVSPRPSLVEDLHRWAALGRLALESRSDRTRSLRSIEELQDEKEHLSEIHRMKSQFIAAVSHELRTPLTSITAYAETLRSPNIRVEEEVKDRFLRVIHDESRRLTRIVDDILDLAMMDAGRVRLSCRATDIVEVVQDALDVIRPIADEKKIRIECSALEPTEVHADPDLLKQLTVSLLENAVKFTEEGGGVGLELERDSTAVRLAICDDGPGIPADKLDAIFERFFQIDGTNARRYAGSGLGLAICKSIVTWHDGRIWAESEEGKGARFVVSLPRIRATSRSRAEKPILKEQELEDYRIPELVIEMISEVMYAEMVSLMLLDETGDELFIQAAMGLPDDAIREVRVSVGDRIAGMVAKSGETLLIPDLDQDSRFQPREDRQYHTRSLISVPIKLRDKTIGVINVTNKTSGDAFNEHDRRLLEILAQRVALVLSKLRDFGSSKGNLERMEKAIRGVIDVRRHYYADGQEFSNLVLAVCRKMGVEDEETARIHYASILRDVGMTLLPEGVYKKPARLTAGDRELIRRHPEEGAKVLRSIEFLPDVFDIILSHHEEPDGSGYPRGLTGPGIPLGAKILAAVDAYHSLRSPRPYRQPVGFTEAIEELRRNSGAQFDEEIVNALVGVLEAGWEEDARRSEGGKAADEIHKAILTEEPRSETESRGRA